MESTATVSKLLGEIRKGETRALEKLIPLVYSELRRLAAHYMRRERPDHTLQTTALVHEAYLRLAGRENKSWQDRAHFFAIAAEAMRSILVDHARAKQAARRGAGATIVPLDESRTPAPQQPEEMLAVDEALTRLARIDARQVRIVELRYFAGMTVPEVAEVLEISERTVMRDWYLAKAWLHGEMRKELEAPDGF